MKSILFMFAFIAGGEMASTDPLVTAAQHQVREWYCGVPKPKDKVLALMDQKWKQNPKWMSDRLKYEYLTEVRRIEGTFYRPYDAMQFCVEMERVLK